MSELIDVAKLRIDGGTQMRAEIDEDTVADYAAAWKAGDKLPPLVVFFDGSVYWLADGFHRYHAAPRAGRKAVDCEVKNGTQRDAVLFAVGANKANGLRRKNIDKHNAVLKLVADKEWATWSDNRIAEVAGVSQPFVSKIRKEYGELITVIKSTAETMTSSTRIGRDGKEYKKKEAKPKTPKSADPVADACDHTFEDGACSKCYVPEPEPPKVDKRTQFNYGANVTDETPAEKPPKNGSAVPAFNDRQVDDLMGKFIRHVDDHYNAIIGLFERRFEEVGGNRKLYDKAKADAESGRRRAHSAAGEVLKSFKAWRESK